MSKLYRQVKLSATEQDEFVFPHKMAMTGEKLHYKSEIAYELGLRDKRIAELEKALQKQTKRVKLLEPLLESEPARQDIRDLEQQAIGVYESVWFCKFEGVITDEQPNRHISHLLNSRVKELRNQAKALKDKQ